MSLTLVDILTSIKESEEGYIAFVESSNEVEYLFYPELYSRALLCLGALQQLGVKRGDEVIFQVENNLEFIITFWACILGGIIPVPLSVGQTDDHKNKIIEVSERLNNPYLVLTEKTFSTLNNFFGTKSPSFSRLKTAAIFIEQINECKEQGIQHSVQPGDIAFIQFSSGSTSHPKGVTLTHSNLLCNMRDIAYSGKYARNEQLLSWMPLTHDMGLIGFHLNPMLCGMSHWIINTNLFIRRPRIWLDLASEHQIEVLCSPNFGYHYLLKHFPGESPDWDLSSVRIIYNGAEPISKEICDQFIEKLQPFHLRKTAICPVYGLAEASLAVAMTPLDQEPVSLSLEASPGVGEYVQLTQDDSDATQFVNVGKAVAHTSIAIADDSGEVLAEKVVGHLLIKGENVTAGYYNDPEVTTSSFHQEWLKTGDLGFISDGNLYITGRSKDIIFINGLNYYPHDLERIAQELDEIDLNKVIICACDNRRDQAFSGQSEINAFVFFRGKVERFVELAHQLKQHIHQKTGIVLDKVLPTKNIPRTTSGKLQRFKVRKEYENGAFLPAEEAIAAITRPETEDQRDTWSPDQRAIVDLTEQICETRVTSLDTSFFDLGLTSLKAHQFLARLSEERGVQIAAADLYQFRTLKALTDAMDEGKFDHYQGISRTDTIGPLSLSAAQERIYYAWQLNKTSTAYNIPFTLKLEGSINQEKLITVFNQVLQEVPTLYFRFEMNEVPVIRLEEQPRFEIQSDKLQEDFVAQLSSLVRPFDLENGPLARVQLLYGDNDQHMLFLDIHHVIFDGISMSILLQQLVNAYQGKSTVASQVRYQDYIIWQGNQPNSGSVQNSRNFWSKQLENDLPVLRLPTDFARKAINTYQGGRIAFELETSLIKGLRKLAVAQGCNTHALLLAVYGLLLNKYTNQEVSIIGIPVSGRSHPDLHQSLGMFVNNLPILLQHSDGQTFKDWMKTVQGIIDEALVHQDYPFNAMVNDLDGRGKLDSGSLLFDTMFIYQNMALPEALDSDCKLTRFDFDPGFSKYDLSLEIFEENAVFSAAFEYSTDLFRQETISTLRDQFVHLVWQAVQKPELLLSEFMLESEQEMDLRIHQYNDTKQAFTTKSVVELFLDKVAQHPEAVAIRCGNQTYSYQEVDEIANKIATKLVALSIVPGDRVIIFGDRSVHAIASMLAALKTGIVYVPVDANEATTKILDISADCEPKVVLTTKSLAGRLPKELEIICIDQLEEADAVELRQEQSAYMIYTSGSTGKPKGVMVGNRSFSNYIQWAVQHYELSQKAFACFTSLSFDLTITSIFTPLVSGGIICLFNEQDQVTQLEKIFEDELVSTIKLTPSHLKLLKNHPSIELPTIARTLIVGGEAFEEELAVEIDQLFDSNVRIFNEYGPTEATVGCMCYEFDASSHSSMFLGQPVANSAIYLLNEKLAPVSDNLIGELYVSGACLAEAYFGNDTLTAVKFLDSPFQPGERLYRTGDLARRTVSGMTYLGRTDNQLKINGHRVEAGEIESKIRRIAGVRDAAVILKNDTLIAYLTGDEDVIFEKSLITGRLAESLPAYMVPRTYFHIEKMPLSNSGKTDYKVLDAIRGEEIKQEAIVTDSTSELETLLIDFWKQVLREDQISTNDNFFELGGDSIKAVQLSSLLFGEGIQVQAQDILIHQTISGLIQHIDLAIVDLQQANKEVYGKKELTPIDHWFFAQEFENPEYYHQYISLDLKKEVVPEVLEQCFRLLIESHDALRMQVSGSELVLLSQEEAPDFNLDVASATDESDFEAITKLMNHSVSFDNGLLLRAALVDFPSAKRLFISCHHLLVDGISWRIILDDLVALLDQASQGDQVKLSAKSASVIDWATSLKEETFPKESHIYWQESEDKRKVFVIQPDADHVSKPYKEANKELFVLDRDWTNELLAAQKESWIDPINTLSTALVFALRDFTGTEEFIVDFENHGRHLPEVNVSRTTGWFTAMYPVQLQFITDNINETVKSVKEQLDRVPDHGLSYTFDTRVRPFSEVRFNFLGDFDQSFESPWFAYQGSASGTWVGKENQMTAKLDMNVWIVDGQLQLEITYHQPSFLDESIEGLGQNFINYLKNILTELKGEVHFTASDFDAIDMDDDLMDSLF